MLLHRLLPCSQSSLLSQRCFRVGIATIQRHPDLQLVKQPLIQKQHAPALDKRPHATGPDAAEPAAHALGMVNDPQARQDRGRLERDGARFRPVRARRRRGYQSLLGVGVFGSMCGGRFGLGGGGGGRRVDLRLQTGLYDVEGTRDDAGEAARGGAGQELQGHANVAALLVDAGPGLELFPKHELQRGKGQVAVERGLVAVEEGRGALGADDCAGGVDGAAVVVARGEMGVVVAALELQPGLEDLGRHVDDGRRQVAEEARREIGEMVLQAVVNEEALAPFVGAEEEERARERAAQRRDPAPVQAPRDALLPPDGVV